MSKRDEYVAKLKDQLDELNALIDELEGKASHLKDETLAKYEKEISGLKKLAESGRESLKELKAAGGDKNHKAFVHSYNYFKSQLK